MRRHSVKIDRSLQSLELGLSTITEHDDSTFTGIIVKVDAGSKLILKEVRIEDGKKLLGPQFFQLSEIKELNLEDCEDDSEKKYSIPTRVNNKTLHKKIQQRHLSKRS